MNKIWNNVWVLGAMVVGLGMSGVVLGATGAGPYYATPSWDQKLDANTRFIVLLNWNSEAVLDRETGLVWEKVPSTSLFNWFNASSHCVNLNTGGRTGWRLPTIQELLSIVDRSASNPSLPSGHPFNVQSSVYWSATTSASNTNLAWFVGFNSGATDDVLSKGIEPLRAWCVRGGQGVDPQ